MAVSNQEGLTREPWLAIGPGKVSRKAYSMKLKGAVSRCSSSSLLCTIFLNLRSLNSVDSLMTA